MTWVSHYRKGKEQPVSRLPSETNSRLDRLESIRLSKLFKKKQIREGRRLPPRHLGDRRTLVLGSVSQLQSWW